MVYGATIKVPTCRLLSLFSSFQYLFHSRFQASFSVFACVSYGQTEMSGAITLSVRTILNDYYEQMVQAHTPFFPRVFFLLFALGK